MTYNGALRYLRVDLGYKITERDPDAAYLLFTYKPSGEKRHLNGSIEIVEAKGKVRLYVQIPQMPKYHEKSPQRWTEKEAARRVRGATQTQEKARFRRQRRTPRMTTSPRSRSAPRTRTTTSRTDD